MKKRLLTLIACVLYIVPLSAQVNDEVTIGILSLNDFHGGFVRNEELGLPGAGNILRIIDSLKTAYPLHVVVAAGDNFGGSYFSNITGGAMIPVFFNEAGITVSAIGNHEFDNGQQFLANKWREERPYGWDITYVCANVLEEKTWRYPFWAVPSVKVPVSGYNVHFVGLIADTAPLQTEKKNVEGLVFPGNYRVILSNIGDISPSEINILLTHIGTEMDNKEVITWTEGENEQTKQIQMDTRFDGILTAHSHKKVCGFKDGMPIVQGEISGKYISVLEVKYSTSMQQVKSVTPKLIDMYRKDYVPGKMDKLVEEVIREHRLDSVVCSTAEKLIHSRSDCHKFTALGSYVCKSMEMQYRKAVEKTGYSLDPNTPVLSFFGFGSVRADLPMGDVTKLDAGEVMPFAGDIVAYLVKGEKIYEFVEYGLKKTGTKGWLQMNNLNVWETQNADGTYSFFIEYRGEDERYAIMPGSYYTVVSVDYLMSGGDGYPPLKLPDDSNRIPVAIGGTTDGFIEYLRGCKLPLRENNPDKAFYWLVYD